MKNKIKKLFVVYALIIMPVSASAATLTIPQLQALIQQLLKQIAQLQIMIAQRAAQNATSTTPITPTFPTTNTLTTPVQPQINPGPEVIDTLDYFLSNHTDKTLTGTHPLSQTVSGNTAYYVKWSKDAYETYSWDNDYIYIKEDRGFSDQPENYTFSPGRWMKRRMKVGEEISVPDNQMRSFKGDACAPVSVGTFPYKMVLESHIPSYNLGGDLGLQDVIVIRYDYSNSSLSDYEKSYYSKEWGMIRWEHYRAGIVIESSTFNKLSTASPIVPNVKSCVNTVNSNVNTTTSTNSSATTNSSANTVASTVSNIPTMPADLNGFVSHLYSCVLNTSKPDDSGFKFWLDDLKAKNLSIERAYTLFFGYQKDISPAVTNDAFAKKLYTCMLFRDSGTEGYNNVMAGLQNGNLNREGLVQTVLNSPEFKTSILPSLQKLVP